jgi:hypothetical protein
MLVKIKMQSGPPSAPNVPTPTKQQLTIAISTLASVGAAFIVAGIIAPTAAPPLAAMDPVPWSSTKLFTIATGIELVTIATALGAYDVAKYPVTSETKNGMLVADIALMTVGLQATAAGMALEGIGAHSLAINAFGLGVALTVMSAMGPFAIFRDDILK